MASMDLAGAFKELETRVGSRGGVTIDFTDLGISKIEKNLQELLRLQLVVGVIGPRAKATYSTGATVGTVALILEFGAEFIPARPFVARALRESAPAIERSYEAQISLVAVGSKSAEDALAAVGKVVADAVLKSLDQADSWAVPLAESTVTAKGSSKPLFDTGALRRSVGYEVRKGGRSLRSAYVA